MASKFFSQKIGGGLFFLGEVPTHFDASDVSAGSGSRQFLVFSTRATLLTALRSISAGWQNQ